MGLSVRRGTKEDANEMAQLGVLMHHESPRFSRNDYNVAKVATMLHTLTDTDMGAYWVALLGDEIVGFFVGVLYPQYFGSDISASDLAVFIAPEHRGSTAAIRMIKEFEKWAFEKGATEINLGVSTEINTERIVYVYEKLGYKITGVNTIKYRER